jgi:hypothetical protein
MSDLTILSPARYRHPLAAALATLAVAAASPSAWAQAMQQQPAQQKSVIIQIAPAQQPPAVIQAAPVQPAPIVTEPVPPVAAVPAPENPGLVNEIGKLFKNSTSLLPAMPSLESWNRSTGLGGTIIKGRVVCPVAANGAPDCKAASDKLCQSKGFKEGKSLDTDAAQSCSAKVMIPGRKQEEGDCRTDNYVTQAVCQ